jgi:hypothetical protein
MSESDKLALEAAQVLVGILDNLLHPSYGSSLCHLRNFHLEEADHLLNLLVAPEDQMRNVEDPVAADILDHLARISSALESAEEVAHLRDIPGYVPSEQALATAVISFANDFAERLFLAYKNLPGSLADLCTLTTSAGARQFRDRPTPPIRRIDKDLKSALNVIAIQASTLSEFLWHAKDAAEDNHDLRAANDFLVAQGLAEYIGIVADESTGSNFIGGALDWAKGGAA